MGKPTKTPAAESKPAKRPANHKTGTVNLPRAIRKACTGPLAHMERNLTRVLGRTKNSSAAVKGDSK